MGNDLVDVPGDTVPWYRHTYLLKLNFCIFSIVLLSSSNGYDGSIMGGLLALQSWNRFMNNPTGVWLGWINAVYFLGSLIGFPLAAWVAQRYGRKTGIYIGYGFLVLAVVVQSASQNADMFIYPRLIFGLASAWFGNAGPLLINEISHPKHRAIASATFMCGFYVGGTISGFTTFGTRNMVGDWSWRLPVLLQALLPVLAIPGILMTPESPRWLISMGRSAEARAIIAKWQVGGNEEDPLVQLQMVEIESAITSEKEVAQSSSYKQMIETPGNRQRLLITITLGIFSQWVGNGVVSYYLPLILTSVGVTSVTNQLLISANLNVWNLLFALAAAACVDKLGRRFLFLCSACVMLVSFIIITGLSGTFATSGATNVGLAVVPFLFIFFAGYDIALTPLLTAYPCEIWPYELRSRGLTVTWLSAIIAIFFNTFVNAIALEAIAWKYYFVFIAVLVAYLLTAFFFYRETRGHTLEQMAVVFDGEDARPDGIESGKLAVEIVSYTEEVAKEWGYYINNYTTLTVNNLARNGRSTRSFINEGLWAQLLTATKAGDFVIIEHGHNDDVDPTSDTKDRGVLPGTGAATVVVTNSTGAKETVHTFGWYLTKMIADVKAKKATPILSGMVNRNYWKGEVLQKDWPFADTAKQVAATEKVEYIDHTAYSVALFQS
ncbi:hypothetical protein KVT40_001852 [Elsinoe batatas]|uniref:Major facilitator superfamily (MFS) profile domain-containing protein n=1 Tax=Elsinoe batatas TaxID=2601811 RepID=A0A8K0LDI9_9PEZI|nr:hypothetical protein KVT40_001852 [Elsinoe batatas]